MPPPTPEPESSYPPPAGKEPAWPAQATVLVAIGLQVALPDRLTIVSRWLLPSLEAALLVGLASATPKHFEREHPNRRRIAIAMIAFVSLANALSLALLTHYLLHHHVNNGHELIIAGSLIWLTNVLIFGLWYWEVDRGGPGRRSAGHDLEPDLLFPQMTDDRLGARTWRPGFVDYLYVSLTNATAFSPTDTMPLTAQAKSLMGLQSLVSLVTIGLIVSRAVNILQ
jgi:uncharacterized membrane protein